MPKCYILSGPPASGKSTFRKKLLGISPKAFVYSTDDYINTKAKEGGTTYAEIFSSEIGNAVQDADAGLLEAIGDGRDVIWDQTNTIAKMRKERTKHMKKFGYEVECIAVRLPSPGYLDAWKDISYRLISREQQIPTDVVMKMYKNYEEPTMKEGFFALIIINIWGHIIESYQR
jgi:tRNA uridine 5-carbamoylmethylation protein Kti12